MIIGGREGDVGAACTKYGRSRCDFKPPRHRGQKFVDRQFLLHPDHRMERARHADIRDVRRTLRKDLLIGGLDMCMRTDDGNHLSVQKMPHGHFFRRRFRMHVDYDSGSLALQS
jgi:hypothetical protein